MSKRKAPEPSAAGGNAMGKQKLGELPVDDQFEDVLGDGADLTDGVMDNADALADAIGDDGGDDEGDEDALLAAALGDDDAPEDEDDGGPEPDPLASGPALPEPGELPDGITEEWLTTSEEVDLSTCGELTLAQARRIAVHLAANEGLEKVKLGSSELPVADLREEGELEWDSEEYTDVEAIILAELLKSNTCVCRLDLARNQIADAGACALALMLGVNSTIEYLNLESNTFGERGGAAFLDALSTNTSVQYLNLMYNSVPTSTQSSMRQAWSRSSRGVGLHL